MKKLGIVGWRGMVGSVLIGRMQEEQDFAHVETTLFSTSQAGEAAPAFAGSGKTLQDAHNLDALAAMDIIITCQGGDYSKAIHPQLRARGWDGYWIDAASALRMDDRAVIILDPVNRSVIDQAIRDGKKDFIGGNCTVSLMLMALGGLFAKADGSYTAFLPDERGKPVAVRNGAGIHFTGPGETLLTRHIIEQINP